MKTKLICWEERREIKNRYANLNRVDKDLYTFKINCKGKRTVGKANKGINLENNNNRF